MHIPKKGNTFYYLLYNNVEMVESIPILHRYCGGSGRLGLNFCFKRRDRGSRHTAGKWLLLFPVPATLHPIHFWEHRSGPFLN